MPSILEHADVWLDFHGEWARESGSGSGRDASQGEAKSKSQLSSRQLIEILSTWILASFWGPPSALMRHWVRSTFNCSDMKWNFERPNGSQLWPLPPLSLLFLPVSLLFWLSPSLLACFSPEDQETSSMCMSRQQFLGVTSVMQEWACNYSAKPTRASRRDRDTSSFKQYIYLYIYIYLSVYETINEKSICKWN